MTPPGSNGQPFSEARCGIVLSAGDGTRMREFVYRLRGDHLPKQYVNFIGKRSMLEHTFYRAEKLIPASRLFTVLAGEHLEFNEVRRQIAWRPCHTVVIQPENKDTVPGILLPLLSLYKQHPDAAVAVFPSDHFILEEDLFMQHVDRAFRLVERDGSRIVLLGIKPLVPDPEYGYIVPGSRVEGLDSDSARSVELFVEKPLQETAKKIAERGALWNTLVFVVRAKTLLDIFRSAAPALYDSFDPVQRVLGRPEQKELVEAVYRRLKPLNFSKAVLEVLPLEHRHSPLVLPVDGVTWSDWGTSDRLMETLRQLKRSVSPAQDGTRPRHPALRAFPEEIFTASVKRFP